MDTKESKMFIQNFELTNISVFNMKKVVPFVVLNLISSMVR